MSHIENSLAVRRQLLPEQHETLLSKTPFVKESCGDLRIRWFDPGTAACGLIERGEYMDALERPGGVLYRRSADAVAQSICAKLTDMPTGKEAIEATVSDIWFTGGGKYFRIAYILSSDELMLENQQLREYIDTENRGANDWEPFIPKIYVASVKSQDAEDDVLEATWQIAQPTFTLLPPAPVLIDP